MKKFIIKCPECGNEFKLTQGGNFDYFQEIQVASYNDHTLLICPNCKHYETDYGGAIHPMDIGLLDREDEKYDELKKKYEKQMSLIKKRG